MKTYCTMTLDIEIVEKLKKMSNYSGYVNDILLRHFAKEQPPTINVQELTNQYQQKEKELQAMKDLLVRSEHEQQIYDQKEAERQKLIEIERQIQERKALAKAKNDQTEREERLKIRFKDTIKELFRRNDIEGIDQVKNQMKGKNYSFEAEIIEFIESLTNKN